ncbi:MAG: L,D-transpeptidase family protein [Candidatus Eisenbacteria bacterium]
MTGVSIAMPLALPALVLSSLLTVAPARPPETTSVPDTTRVAAAGDSLHWPEPGDVAGEWLGSWFATTAGRRDSLADVRAELARVYAARDYRRFWSSGDWPRPQAARVVAALRGAVSHGLDPAQYDPDLLAARLARMAPPWAAPSPAELGRLDLLLSTAASRYAAALAGGRVPPRLPHPSLRNRVVRIDRGAVLDTLVASADPAALLEDLAPHTSEYRRLRAALADYHALDADSAIARLARRATRPLKVGERWPDAGGLRHALWRAGGMSDSVYALRHRDSLVTRAMIQAARVISRRDSVPFDGTLHPPLDSLLTHDLATRERAVVLALERQRWFTRDFPAPPIVVNIPSFEMRYWTGVTADSGTVMHMRVCVGGADSTQTPPLSDRLYAVVFRPNWNIPKSIMLKEIRPKALEDSTYLLKNRYELVQGNRVVPPTAANVDAIGVKVRVRQKSGEGNALGDIKFALSNSEAIYMHDTPMRAPFHLARRDVSHGCVRLQDAHSLARYLLRDDPVWPPERIMAATKADTTTIVPLDASVPVEIVYWTAVTRSTGGLELYPDIYHHDDPLDSLLHLRYPLPR